ncbi:MAG: thioredoxin family protein [Actinobacteria bacterium]|nr:thioredoxin family protein [Actinomycetota bacterium]
MRIELLYFDGCPSHEELLPRLRELVAKVQPDAEVELHRIETSEEAGQERFLGSPTVRVDGVDVDPGVAGRTDFGLECRLYRSEGVVSRTPPDAWIEAALRRGRRGSG